MIDIQVSYPPRILSPNARCHWAPKRKAIRAMRDDAFRAAVAALAGQRPMYCRAKVEIAFYHPTKHKRDPDNLLAMLKPVWDGFQRAHLFADDDQLEFTLHPPRYAARKDMACVAITVTPLE